jgi:hypothetical protein
MHLIDRSFTMVHTGKEATGVSFCSEIESKDLVDLFTFNMSSVCIRNVSTTNTRLYLLLC